MHRANIPPKTHHGWEFMDKDLGEAPSPLSEASPPRLRATALVPFFSPALATCACCDKKLHGEIFRCALCHKDAHEVCVQHGHYLRCICCVCPLAPVGVMTTCKQCRLRVHHKCCKPVLLEAICHLCSAPKPTPPPLQPTFRKFKQKWCEGRPWVCHEHGLMWCAADREYPQGGVHQSWVDAGGLGV